MSVERKRIRGYHSNPSPRPVRPKQSYSTLGVSPSNMCVLCSAEVLVTDASADPIGGEEGEVRVSEERNRDVLRRRIYGVFTRQRRHFRT